MANNFLCPVCKGHLRIGDSLVISAKSKTNKKGLLLLNPEIGNYSKTTHPTFEIEKGGEYYFYCPICHATLNSEKSPNLIRLILIDDKDLEYEVFFSNIGDERCTFKVSDKKVEFSGPDAESYKKYFDVPKESKKYL